MGTCSVTCQAHGNPPHVSDKYKPNENLRPDDSNVNNNHTRPSPYVKHFSTIWLEEYHEPISYAHPPPLPDLAGSLSPISMIKPIRRRDTVTLIRAEREKLANERREFERSKQVHDIQETFKEAYRNSFTRPRTEGAKK